MPSSVIDHMTYDGARHVLRIVYVSGAVYDYLKVPEQIYNEMKAATSKGTFLNTRIKGNYEFRKVK